MSKRNYKRDSRRDGKFSDNIKGFMRKQCPALSKVGIGTEQCVYHTNTQSQKEVGDDEHSIHKIRNP